MANPFAIQSSEELTLERLKVAAQERIGAHVLASVQLETWRDPFLDGLAAKLATEVLSERVLDSEVTLGWSGDALVDVPRFEAKCQWASLALAALLACLTPLMGVGALIAAFMLALLGVLLLALNPAVGGTTEKVRVQGDVTVPATYWRKFPEVDTVYPKAFGAPIRYVQLGTPSWERR